jgi:hypothetical protein
MMLNGRPRVNGDSRGNYKWSTMRWSGGGYWWNVSGVGGCRGVKMVLLRWHVESCGCFAYAMEGLVGYIRGVVYRVD